MTLVWRPFFLFPFSQVCIEDVGLRGRLRWQRGWLACVRWMCLLALDAEERRKAGTTEARERERSEGANRISTLKMRRKALGEEDERWLS